MQNPTAHVETIILTGRDLARLMRPADYRDAVDAAFRAAGEGHGASPSPMHIAAAHGGGFHAKGAGFAAGELAAGGRAYVAVKVNGNFPSNPQANGLPTIQGALMLSDGEDGRVLALMDSIELTLQRTAAATAVAALRLARPESAAIAICGCGAQGRPQLAALLDVLPLRRAVLFDRDPAAAGRLATEANGLGLEAHVAADLAEATRGADVIVTCSTSRAPFLTPDLVAPGTFVAAVGADNPEKSEIDLALMAAARVVCDVRAQCAVMGDLAHAIAAGAMRLDDVHADLADLVTGRRPGRTDVAQVTLFDSTGTALQDVASAAVAYERATALGVGTRLAL